MADNSHHPTSLHIEYPKFYQHVVSMMAVLKIAEPTCGIQSLAPGLANATVARIAKYKRSNFMAVYVNLIPKLLIRCPKMGWLGRER